MGSSADVDVTINPSTTTVNSENTIDIVGLDDINLTSNSTLTTNATVDMGLDDINLRTELVLPQPLKTQSEIDTDLTSNMTLDIKPMVLDLCLKLDFDLPEKCVRQPYNHHFGITLFGVELLGFNFVGESRIILEDLPKRPQVAVGGEHVVAHQPGQRERSAPRPSEGLRIRLG
ncbi:MAG: hypothetical protein M5R40_17110 [Anaerolineae bacterium]|nr:hypothetical protein [Anaerolineae bacterium]